MLREDGWQVLGARSLENCLEFVVDEDCAVVLLDRELEGLDDVSLARLARRLKHLGVEIVLYSNREAATLAQVARAAGIGWYLTREDTGSTLRSMLRTLWHLRSRSQQPAPGTRNVTSETLPGTRRGRGASSLTGRTLPPVRKLFG